MIRHAVQDGKALKSPGIDPQGGEPQPKGLGRSMHPLRAFPSSVQPRRLLRLFRRPLQRRTRTENTVRICVSSVGGPL